jgi:putative transposase
MVYAFIRSEQDHHPVMVMCKVLSVSRSSYYAYCKSGDGAQKRVVKVVEQQVVNAFTAHRRRYGIRRLIPELQAQGLTIGHYKVRGILRRHGLAAIQPRSFVPRTTNSRHPYQISPNLVSEQAFPVKINQVWVGDITYIPLKGGQWGYLAVWMDLFSRRVTGWQLADHMREELVLEAFKKALGNRNAAAGSSFTRTVADSMPARSFAKY